MPTCSTPPVVLYAYLTLPNDKDWLARHIAKAGGQVLMVRWPGQQHLIVFSTKLVGDGDAEECIRSTEEAREEMPRLLDAWADGQRPQVAQSRGWVAETGIDLGHRVRYLE